MSFDEKFPPELTGERLSVTEYWAGGAKAYAVYAYINDEGFSWGVTLREVEPRDTLLERGREEFKKTYPNIAERYKEIA